MNASIPSTSRLLHCSFAVRLFFRTVFRPPRNLPYRGIYRTDGERCLKGELLVCQVKLNYHPGLNVYLQRDRGLLLLKSHTDGTVVISRERIKPDPTLPENAEYLTRINDPIYKLTFNVMPFKMSRTFSFLVN